MINAPATAFDFDLWRENYDSMTFADHVETYAELQRLYPVQRHFDANACSEFIDLTPGTRVLEIGGWDGELAREVLGSHDLLRSWENVEICKEVRDHPVFRDTRYTARATSDFAWVCGCYDHIADTLVMSHVAEHMRWKELQALLSDMPKVRAIYLASPLPQDGSAPDWTGYPGTHILEVGWDSISAFLGGLGFRQMAAPRTHEVRCWQKP
jgi:hypothetical protein